MIIRKLFKFENAHIVRGCTTQRCSTNIHGHSYQVEVLLESKYLDNGDMVYDFGLIKFRIKEFIDSFDHSITLYNRDNIEYINDMKKHSKRWIELPVSPSAEQFSRVIFIVVDKILESTIMVNGEKGVKLNSIIVHETKSGYAQCFRDDAYSMLMGEIDINEIKFSEQTKLEWSDINLWDRIKNRELIENPNKI
ncbi:6-carboxytetrahydropterin synthase @ Queuosine biosynthesis QueD, PTPS-I [hydrothermal vent metagenome]|uniref:6-carboxytetrahydropterin synthase @ Queuosine biosynthesis QueD, PTPS-I n=1 Tax=hydrothermal vent metagenome TaxID=652676 RepID=A0A1W1EKZ9_9ZZZZ